MENKITIILSNFNKDPQNLVSILQEIQNEFGYLPEKAIEQTAIFLQMSKTRIYAIATFLAQFHFTPIGKNHILVCQGSSCCSKGSNEITNEIETLLKIKAGETSEDLNYTLERVSCIGACQSAPCMMVNKKVETNLTKERIKELITEKK